MGIKSTRPGGSGAGRGDVPHEIVTRYKAHIFPDKFANPKSEAEENDWTPPNGIERPKL